LPVGHAYLDSAAITPQTNMPQSTTLLQVILLSQASSTGRIGSTTTAQKSSLQGLSYLVLTPTRWISPYLDRPDGCPKNGNHSSTNKVRLKQPNGKLLVSYDEWIKSQQKNQAKDNIDNNPKSDIL
jgi:hypothetical protein